MERRYTQIQVSIVLICSSWKQRVTDVFPAEFVSPAAVRSALKREKGAKYGARKLAEEESRGRKELRRLEEDELAVSKVFS